MDACGGDHHVTTDFTSVTITSPNYPNSPNPFTECSWTILAPPEKSLSLHFEGHFNIPGYPDGCDQAYVEVRDGGTILSPLLGRFCSSTLPDTQHTTGDALYVRYYNNLMEHHSGFKATAAIDVCGGTYNAWESGIITTPNYPTPYAASLNCTWTIIAPMGHYVTLHFLDVEILSPNNNCTNPSGLLSVQDTNATGEVLASICGSPEDVPPVNTYSNIAFINFTAGPNHGQKGFRIMYNKSLEVCGGEVSGAEGEIQSPGYPHGYVAHRRCVWLITGPIGKRISLEFLDIDLAEAPYGGRIPWLCSETIQIGNGIVNPAFIYPICSSVNLESSYNSSMNTMTVIFTTRGHSSSRGFRARWTTEDPQECGGELDLDGGELTSLGLDNSTHRSHYCVWTLNNPRSTNASFKITFSVIEKLPHCYHSYVLIEGVDSEGRAVEVKKICGSFVEAPLVVAVPYHTLRITYMMHMVLSVSRIPIWSLSYSVSSCGGVLHGPQDVITSPNFPSNYNNNEDCVWLLHYAEGEQIDFQFTSFILENALHHDYVIVRNGPRYSSPQLGRYTGSRDPWTVGRSMTNNLLVEFHTDDTTTMEGFRAVAARHIRGCGGHFHGKKGNFSSHGFPNPYDVNTECEWEVDTPAGYHAILTFNTQFDVETSENCQNDYVQVFHAEQTEPHTPVQWVADEKVCGKQLPSPIVSLGSRVKVFFHSNDAVTGNGFQMSWQMVCGNNYTQPSGYVVSPGHPGDYPPNLECVYRIVADPEQFININFLHFNLEGGRQCYYDYIRVREETVRQQWSWRIRNQNTRSWGPYCGDDRPPSLITRGTTTITFHSDYSIQKSGFIANYSIQVCGGNITTPSVLNLPTQPNYQNHMECVWDLTAPDGRVPHIKFQKLVLESHHQCRFDSISVYDGHASIADKLVARFCGNHTMDLPVVVTHENNARIVFKSDHSVTYEGFKAAVEFTYACGGNVNISREGASQTIRSFSRSGNVNYEPMLECSWLVEGLEDNVVNLTFTRLHLEPPGVNDTDSCPYDYVKIFDGPSVKSSLIATYCNASSLPLSVSSSTNLMYIHFSTDSANQFPGFTAIVTNTPHPCGTSSLQATNESQVLQSPQYPNHYPTNIRCRWVISAPEEDQDIHLDVTDMSLEASQGCSKDQLYISEYIPMDPTSQIIHTGVRRRYPMNVGGRMAYFYYGSDLAHGYCGSTIPHHLLSSSNAVELKFTSDASVTDSGFRLHYSLGNCNRTYNGTSGSVKVRTSSSSCFTTFEAPEGSFVNLYFVNFYIRNRGSNCTLSNSLKIYDGRDSSSPMLLFACGYQTPSPVFSTGNVLYLAHTPQSWGSFRLTYLTSTQGGGCGGSMYVRSTSIVTSPGYPGSATPNLDCLFTISVQPTQHVILSFRNLDFGTSDTCNSTYLEVYDVNMDGQSTLFNTLCGDEGIVSEHLAPSNRMVLRYVTGSGNITGQGWRAWVHQGQPHESTVFDED